MQFDPVSFKNRVSGIVGSLVNKEDLSRVDSFKKTIKELKNIRKGPFNPPVMIIAGGASHMEHDDVCKYRDFLIRQLSGFAGTVISGGTTVGIPGLVGEVKGLLEKEGPLGFNLVGYLPEKVPDGIFRSMAYDAFYETSADHFSSLEVFSYWFDIAGNGTDPDDVTVLGLGGGEIAALEYRIALFLGAKVTLIKNSGNAVAELLKDDSWRNKPNLAVLVL